MVQTHKYVLAHLRYMPNITLSIPDKLHKEMKKYPEIKWSAVARRAIEERIDDLNFIQEKTSKSTLTKREIIDLSKKVNSAVAKKLGLK